jgi:signal transduction histidine kinase
LLLIDEAIGQLRAMVFDLHPTMLDDLGLVPTLERYAERFRALTKVSVVVSETGARGMLSSRAAGYLFRSVKELLANAATHGAAREVVVSLHWREATLRLVVDDDGRGMDTSKIAEGVGLPSVRERITALGGRVQIESKPGQGTRVVLELPLTEAT